MLIENITYLGVIEAYIIATFELRTLSGFTLTNMMESWIFYVFSFPTIIFIFPLFISFLFFKVYHSMMSNRIGQFHDFLKSLKKNRIDYITEYLDVFLLKQSVEYKINASVKGQGLSLYLNICSGGR